MNSAQAVARKMKDISVSDKDFFTSSYFVSYLKLLLSASCREIKRAVPTIVVMHDPSPDAHAAYTDGRTLTINAGCWLVNLGKTRAAKAKLIIGMMLHEFGHYRFTDMEGCNKAATRLEAGNFTPDVPKDADDNIIENRDDVAVFISESEVNARGVVAMWHHIHNILEDGYIEEALYRTQTGILIDGLDALRKRQLSSTPTLGEMLRRLADGEAEFWHVMQSILLMYVKYGSLKMNWRDPEERSSEPVRILKECKKYIDPLLYESDTIVRLNGTNHLFLQLWPMLKEYILKHPSPEEMESAMSAGEGSSMSSSPTRGDGTSAPRPVPVSPEEDTGKSGSAAARDDTSKHMDDDSYDGTGDSDSAGEVDDGEVLTPGSSEGIEDTFEIDDEFSDRGFEESMASLERRICEDTAIREVSEELTSELKKEASGFDYGSAHSGLNITVERVSSVRQETKELFDRAIKPIDDIATIMAKKLAPILKKDKSDEMLAMTGFYSGSRFDATRLVMNDCRVFKKDAVPMPDKRLALTVLIDESGSMGGSRINAAREAALALYLFCQKVGVKCSVVGHTSKFGVGDLRLQAYADFDSPDRDDKYRLMSISARQDNRDGAAIAYAGKRLLKRSEPVKMMVIISDGAPDATGYRGRAAETDMSNIAAELRRRGVTIFAAAIGSDKEKIQRIFGEGFIDITDLSTLPAQLLSLVKRYIK